MIFTGLDTARFLHNPHDGSYRDALAASRLAHQSKRGTMIHHQADLVEGLDHPFVGVKVSNQILGFLAELSFSNTQPGQAGTKNEQSRKHEMTKARNKAEEFFVFSNFRVFVIKISFHKMQRIQNYELKLNSFFL